MVTAARGLPSTMVLCVMVFIFVSMAGSSSAVIMSKPPWYSCQHIVPGFSPERYHEHHFTLLCPAFSVFRSMAPNILRIYCATNNISTINYLKEFQIGNVDMLEISLCPLPSVSVSQYMQLMSVSNVTNVQIKYKAVEGNFTTTVAHDLFHSLPNIISLKLHIVITQVSDDAFTNIANLTHIDSKNNIVILSKAIFYSVSQLQVLELVSYNVTYLEPGVFHNLTQLRFLKLSGNLCNISRVIFSDVHNLESLAINSNQMASLQPDLFEDLIKLQKIELQENKFQTLPENLFFHSHGLETVSLKDNRQLKTLPPRLLANLTKLKEVILIRCNILTVPEDLLWGSVSVDIITLRNNKLTTLPELLFKDCTQLHTLDLSFNQITILPKQLFSNMNWLRTLKLNDNQLTTLPQNLFINNQVLETIILHDNRRTLKTLPPKLLAKLSLLKEIKLNNCNISTLPEDLLWDSTLIDNISLRNNTLTTLPELLFRDCRSLRSVDISFNRITDLSNKLFSNTLGLKILLLNDNQLTVITDYSFSHLNDLITLDLKNNGLTNIGYRAFPLHGQLTAVNLSNNMLSFENKISKDSSPLYYCSSLRDIQLANNSLTRIFHDWRQMTYLKTLNVSHNQITQLQATDFQFKNSFSSLSRSLFVDISYNNISKIVIFDAGTFQVEPIIDPFNLPEIHFFIKNNPISCDCNVYNLLQYEGDRMNTVLKFIMETKPNDLHCYTHTGQQVVNIPLKPFACLLGKDYSLNCPEQCNCQLRPSDKALIVDCHKKNLTSIPETLPDIHFSNYTELILSGNSIKSVKSLLGPVYNKVTKYNLSDNMISEINLTAFSPKLQVADLQFISSYNKFIIDVSYNNISKIDIFDEKTVYGKTELENINIPVIHFFIEGNPIKCDCNIYNLLQFEGDKITAVFKLVMETKSGNLPCVKLEPYTGQRVVNIPLNLFTCLLGKDYGLNCPEQCSCILRHSDKVLIVDCHQKNLISMPEALPDIYNSNHTELILSGNSIKSIKSPLGPGYYKVTKYNLSHNMISEIDLTAFSSELQAADDWSSFVDLNHNNISEIDIFDTGTVYRNTILENINVINFHIKDNPINCDCNVYSFLQFVRGKITAELKLTIETEPGNLQCDKLEPYAGHLVKNIPLKLFNCLLRKQLSPICSEQCNCLLRPSDKTLIVNCHMKNLTSMPEALPDIQFSNQTELILSGNSIKSVKPPLGPGYYKVTKYTLSNNTISEIDLTAFSPTIQVLEVDGNKIDQFNTSSVEFLINATYLTQLTLHKNPWKCNCTIKEFVAIIRSVSHLKKINPLDNITCENGKAILEMSDSDLCSGESENVIDVSFTVAALALLFAVIAFYYRFDKEIKVWLYAHHCCLWFINEEELDKDKVYDAFISYSHSDEDFVADNLVPGLEDGPIKYKVCVHYRDWIVGEFISTQIVNSVELSRRTIVVLSRDFLESVWGRMEFRAAHKQALSEKRNRVIVILYGEIGPTDNLDPELRTYLTMNTYIKWGDSLFWEKLRYALPHDSKLCNEIPLQEIV